MKSRILEGRGRLAGHEYWTVGAQKRSRILRGMAASFEREVGHGFGCDGARKVNERAVLVVLVDAVELVGCLLGDGRVGCGWQVCGSRILGETGIER